MTQATNQTSPLGVHPLHPNATQKQTGYFTIYTSAENAEAVQVVLMNQPRAQATVMLEKLFLIPVCVCVLGGYNCRKRSDVSNKGQSVMASVSRTKQSGLVLSLFPEMQHLPRLIGSCSTFSSSNTINQQFLMLENDH